MIKNEELPIGFTMELAQHSDQLNQFSHMTRTEQEQIIHKAQKVQSREEMRNLVESISTQSSAGKEHIT